MTTARFIRAALAYALTGLTCFVLVIILALAYFIEQAGQREQRSAEELAPPTGRFIKTGDVTMFIQEAGPPSGPTVILVHGTGAWSETWRSPMSTLAGQGFHAIAIDLPPFGFSQRPTPPIYDKHRQGRRIVGLLDALHVSQTILIGHSFGAGPTVEAALLVPERVRALILVDAALNLLPGNEQSPPPPSRLMQGFLSIPFLRDGLVATFLTNPSFTRRLLEFFVWDPATLTDDWVHLYQHPLPLRDSTRAAGEWLPSLLLPSQIATSEIPSTYQSLRIPVSLVWGDHDTVTPLAQAERLSKLIPNAQLITMTSVGHIPHLENTQQFNQLLLELVVNLRPPAS